MYLLSLFFASNDFASTVMHSIEYHHSSNFV